MVEVHMAFSCLCWKKHVSCYCNIQLIRLIYYVLVRKNRNMELALWQSYKQCLPLRSYTQNPQQFQPWWFMSYLISFIYIFDLIAMTNIFPVFQRYLLETCIVFLKSQRINTVFVFRHYKSSVTKILA